MATLSYPDGANSTDTVTNLLGWGNYRDGETSPATQTFTSTASKLQIDSLGSTTNETYLPVEIRGISSLWDGTNDKITPVAVGDSYDLRIDLTVATKASNPTILTLQLDIGGTGTPSIVVVSRDIGLSKTAPFTISVGFPIFCLSTFKTNGGDIFLSTDTGSVEISSRGIFLSRNSSANA